MEIKIPDFDIFIMLSQNNGGTGTLFPSIHSHRWLSTGYTWFWRFHRRGPGEVKHEEEGGKWKGNEMDTATHLPMTTSNCWSMVRLHPQKLFVPVWTWFMVWFGQATLINLVCF